MLLASLGAYKSALRHSQVNTLSVALPNGDYTFQSRSPLIENLWDF
jgi:hypothetical protein